MRSVKKDRKSLVSRSFLRLSGTFILRIELDGIVCSPVIVNLQRKVKIEASAFNAFVAAILASVDEAGERHFSVAFVSDRRMKELNQMFRGRNSTTDVLSFPNEPDEFEPETHDLGDIVISVEQAQRQAIENSLSLDLEIKQLIVHGVLHLCGYDHEADSGEMNARELELRDRLSING